MMSAQGCRFLPLVATGALLLALLAACERNPNEPFPQAAPGQFSFTVSGSAEREVTGPARFLVFDDSRSVILDAAPGYPRLTFEGGYSGTPLAFPIGTHRIEPGFAQMAVVLELSSNPNDWYFGYNGEVRVQEADASRIVAQFEFTGSGRAGSSIRVRGAFHAAPAE